jgi:hypothetical protein
MTQSSVRAVLAAVFVPMALLAAAQDEVPRRTGDFTPAVVSNLVIEHGVTVTSMLSDRFTWRDASNQPRVAALAHNNGAAGPGGTYGGELREFRYETPGGTRIVRASGGYASGFGYVVSHRSEGGAGIAADDSPLGHFFSGTFQRVFEGRHHAIFRFTQLYPRYSRTDAAPPNTQYNVPVTVDWVISTGRDHPLWAVTWDLSGVPVNAVDSDSRAPYGELLFDGASSEGAHSVVAGVGWGDRYKFESTTDPVTYNSAWTWSAPNTIPYVKLWTSAVDATMGTVQTQTIVQQDAGGYWGTGRWGTTSAGGNACGAQVMPCDYNWPYQSINYSLVGASATNNTRLAWGTNFGFLGQSSYLIHGSADYGGPLPNTSASGWPKKSYSTFVVFGLDSADPVGAQVAQIETVQDTTLTAAIGSVLTTGPAGVNRADTVTYDPAGWNHVYAAWALQAAANKVDANFNVVGTLAKPLIIVSNWTAGLPDTVRLSGVPAVQDTDYFPSVRADAHELWITLNAPLAGANNRVEISSTPVLPPTGNDATGDGLADVFLRVGSSGEIRVASSTGAAFTLQAPWTSGFVDYRYDVYFADVNGDGKADLISRNKGTGAIDVFASTGTAYAYAGGTGPGGVWSYGWGTTYNLYFADVTGDGKADLIGRHGGNGDVYVFPSTGAGFSSAPPGGLWSYGWSSGYDLYFADVTGDGKADIASRYFGPTAGLTGDVYVGASTGAAFASPTRWTYGYSAGYEVNMVDVTGDGRADFVTRYNGPNSGISGNVYVMSSTGTGFTWNGNFGPWTYGYGSSYEVVFRDVTGDGKADLVSRNRNSGSGGYGRLEVAASTGVAFSYLGTNPWLSGITLTYEVK